MGRLSGVTSFEDDIRQFAWNGRPTDVETTAADCDGHRVRVKTFTNEFWTSKQRAGHSLHEISYRACFKPQLVNFFVQRLTEPGDLVYDPFLGRGTTVVEAALLDRAATGCDVNPLSRVLTKPRLAPPTLAQVSERLRALDWTSCDSYPEDLTVFFHPETLNRICALRAYLRKLHPGTGVQQHPANSVRFGQARCHVASVPRRRQLRIRQLAALLVLWH